jgi:hypothetical protein
MFYLVGNISKGILTIITYEQDTAPWWAFKLNSVPAAAEK